MQKYIMKEIIIHKCLEILKRQDIKNEIKIIMSPIIDLILKEIYPYIYISLIFVMISFFLILAIFILLLRNKQL
jgi:hypothetical protein